MKNLLFLISVGLCAAPDGHILERASREFASYSTVKGIDRYATVEEYRAAGNDGQFTLERIVYSSQDIPVVAYIYGPKTSGAQLPAIVFVRGGYRDTEISLYAPMMHRFAQSGFLVVAPMLRGSDGAPGTDELGGGELADVLTARKLVTELPNADPQRVYLLGESRGGMMVYQALRDGFSAKAAAVIGAFTDQAQMLDAQPQMKPMVEKLWNKESP